MEENEATCFCPKRKKALARSTVFSVQIHGQCINPGILLSLVRQWSPKQKITKKKFL